MCCMETDSFLTRYSSNVGIIDQQMWINSNNRDWVN